MSSPFFTVQFIVVALLAALGLLTLGRWLRTREYRAWTWAWLAWALGAASLSFCSVTGAPPHLFLIGHTLAFAVFGALLAAGAHLTIQAPEVRYEKIRSMHWIVLGALTVITVLSIWWRWPFLRGSLDFWRERYFWSGPWLVGYCFFTIWILTKHRSRWTLRPTIVLFVLALLLLATTEGVVTSLLLTFEGRASATGDVLIDFLMCLEPPLAGFLALAMLVMVMDSLVHRLERSLVNSSRRSARLKRLAERDPLTAVLNRHAFYSLLGPSREGNKRPPGGTVAVVDIDNLKPMNDTYGHQAGDVAIRAVAKGIRSIIRAEDLLFRWGGDEFLVILPHVDSAEARERLGKLDNLLSRVVLPGASQPVPVTLSVGVAEFSTTIGLERAIEEADERMYALKLRKKET